MAAVAEDVLRIKFKGPLARFMKDRTRFIDLEGALNCGKTTACLWKEFIAAWELWPGIWSFIGRYSDGDNSAKLIPAWERIVREAGVNVRWSAKELCYEFPNGPNPDDPFTAGSRVYSFGLKSPDALSRYAKLRGLGVSRIYIDQAEELPPDFFPELVQRMRQNGFPHQLTLSPNPLSITSWLAAEFPDDNRKANRVYYSISLFDNAHNLPPEKIQDALDTYPPSHAKHRTAILGKRGLNVVGEPVYKEAFVRSVHEGPAEYDKTLPVLMALDFGKHHPCVVFRQDAPLGQARLLGGLLGLNMYLDDFIDVVLRYRAEWFPEAWFMECCDPAGAADTSHGTEGAVKALKAKGIFPRYVENSNSPLVRLACIERMAARMRKRAADRSEAFVISNSDRWLLVSSDGVKFERFLSDGFEAGYVWDVHMVSVDNKQVRRPKKDGFYEHGQNCAEYLELNFGGAPVVKKATVMTPPKRAMHSPPPRAGGMGWAR
jgi:hypothetical protein